MSNAGCGIVDDYWTMCALIGGMTDREKKLVLDAFFTGVHSGLGEIGNLPKDEVQRNAVLIDLCDQVERIETKSEKGTV